MPKRRLAALFLALGVATAMPALAFAASADGLVPCGVSSDLNAATECQACHAVSLVHNIINFMIGLAIPIAVVMIAYGGFLYFTSGTGGSENISKAKKIFSASLIGFVLALCAWLIVNTILNTILDHDQYPNSSWFTIDCSSDDARPRTETIDQVIARYLPGFVPTVTTPEVGDFKITCAQGTYDPSKQFCVDETGKIVGRPTVTSTFVKGEGVVCPSSNPACSPQEIIRQTGVSQARANAMSCIAVTESSGNPNAKSKTSTACGTWQLLKSNWDNPSLHSGSCANASCTDVYCNMQAAIALGNASKKRTGSYYSDWTCPGCNAKASACVAKYDPGN